MPWLSVNKVQAYGVGNGMWYVVCGVWCVVCGVWCVVCGVWCMVYVGRFVIFE